MPAIARLLFALAALLAVALALAYGFFAAVVVRDAFVPAWLAGQPLPEPFRVLNVRFSGPATAVPVLAYGLLAALTGTLAVILGRASVAPRQAVRATTRGLWAGKVLITILIIAWAVYHGALQPATGPRLPVPTLAAQLLAFVGALVVASHYLWLRGAAGRGELVTDRGLYRVCRHPMYLGDLLLYGGIGLLAADPVALALLLLLLAAEHRLARAEDATMAATFGESWAAWAARTGRLLPRAPPSHRSKARPGAGA